LGRSAFRRGYQPAAAADATDPNVLGSERTGSDVDAAPPNMQARIRSALEKYESEAKAG